MRGRVRAAITGLAWALPLLWIADRLVRRTHCDIALLLEAAERWLAGERLYVQVIDVNPPLIIWLSALPVRFEKWFGLLDAAGWYAALVGAAAILAALAVRSLTPRAAGRWAGLAAFWALVILPGYDFGQREHLIACAALVWLAAAAGRVEGQRAGAGDAPLAAICALAVCLKPNFLLVPAAVELAVLASLGMRRWITDPWPLALAIVPLAYALAVLVATPEYVSVALPLIAALYIPAGLGFVGVLAGRALLVAAALLIGAAAVAWSRAWIVRGSALATLAALVAGAVQGKGWTYHLLPAAILLAWTAALLLGEIVARGPSGQAWRGLRALPAAAALAATVVLAPSYRYLPFEQPYGSSVSLDDQFAALFAAYAGDDDVLVLAMDVWPFYPALLEAKAQMGMRFFTLWPIAGAYPNCAPFALPWRPVAAMPAAERFAFHGIVADFVTRRPALVVVQGDWRPAACGNRPFDLLAYFRRDPAFARAFAGYTRLASVGKYTLFRRRPAAARSRWPLAS